jgi:uncharacterized protein YciI
VQYLLIAYDDDAPGGHQRRMAARNEHLTLGNELKEAGVLLYAAALLDHDGGMIGSMEVLDFESQKDIDDYLDIEPYVLQNVWKDVSVQPCRPGPAFAPISEN